MRNSSKYRGIFPAFYACYDDQGEISAERTRQLAVFLMEKGVNGLYVGGSSGECIYQSVAERKIALENVMRAVGGKLTIIAHVACNNTRDSQELAAHAQSLNVDAIASIPPIYFHLPPHGIASYWNDISAAAPDTDFFIYNIPQLAGVALTPDLLKEMLKNPRVVGVKNSSLPTMDIQQWKDLGREDFTVFNGPDEQLIAGLAIGADGGIGGTYGVMPELFIRIYELVQQGRIPEAKVIQNYACRTIYKMCSAHGSMYAVIKAVLARKGVNCGGVRSPLSNLIPEDSMIVDEVEKIIQEAMTKL